MTRRKVRARNKLLAASADLPFAYKLWIKRVERNRLPQDGFCATIKAWQRRPRFSVLVYGCSAASTEEISRSRQSAQEQVYRCAQLVAEEAMVSDLELITQSDADFVVPVRAGDALADTALFRFAEALQQQPEARILYGDHDYLSARLERTRPWFKPEWNEELFLAQDYLTPAIAIRNDLAREAASYASASNDMATLVLEAALSADARIAHIPHIISHVGTRSGEPDSAKRTEALARRLKMRSATCSPGPFGSTRVRWPLPASLPKVSIIVPTKDKLDLLRPCIETVLGKTSYPNFEILIVDNDSVEPRTLEYLSLVQADPRIRVLAFPHSYNFSAINNFAAASADGTFLCLLNNDTEVLEADWLTEMMRYAVRPEIGAVGAKLIYEDGSIQHAGVVVGIGNAAGHAHRFLPASERGYFAQAHVAQYVTAVTAACLVVSKDKFAAVGGLDEDELHVAFNDVDFCLKLREQGWLNVYVPHAVLVHHESKSRGKDIAPENIDRYRRELNVLQQRWATRTYVDPLHNRNLDRYSETFVIAF